LMKLAHMAEGETSFSALMRTLRFWIRADLHAEFNVCVLMVCLPDAYAG
jgi:hypothetical protein